MLQKYTERKYTRYGKYTKKGFGLRKKRLGKKFTKQDIGEKVEEKLSFYKSHTFTMNPYRFKFLHNLFIKLSCLPHLLFSHKGSCMHLHDDHAVARDHSLSSINGTIHLQLIFVVIHHKFFKYLYVDY